jgi:MOSC domain-containing protein YiiM
VVTVSADAAHGFSKRLMPSIQLLAGLGVEGDAHCGRTVQHRSRVRVDPSQPNLRQVHLLQRALMVETEAAGLPLSAGDLGENILTDGIDLLGLPRGAQLRIGTDAIVEITGLRNPCHQIEDFRPGLLAKLVGRAPDGTVWRRAGVMGIVVVGGVVRPGDRIVIDMPPAPFQALDRV